jgi:hypothetical protein
LCDASYIKANKNRSKSGKRVLRLSSYEETKNINVKNKNEEENKKINIK